MAGFSVVVLEAAQAHMDTSRAISKDELLNMFPTGHRAQFMSDIKLQPK